MSTPITAREALEIAINTMESVRIFVNSKERIKQPEGADFYEARIDEVKTGLASLSVQPARDSAKPVAWAIPGDLLDCGSGWIDAKIAREGEFTKPLYEHPPAPVETGWQNIAKHRHEDEKDVLVYCADTREQFVAYWDDHEHAWVYARTGSHVVMCVPTHFRPLPPAPSTGEG